MRVTADQELPPERDAPISNLVSAPCHQRTLIETPGIRPCPGWKGEKLPGMRVDVRIAPHISQTSAQISNFILIFLFKLYVDTLKMFQLNFCLAKKRPVNITHAFIFIYLDNSKRDVAFLVLSMVEILVGGTLPARRAREGVPPLV